MPNAMPFRLAALAALFMLWPAALSAQAPSPTPTTLPGDAPPLSAPTAAAPVYHDPASQVDVYDQLTDDMFPASWRDPKVAATALPMASTERDRALRLMKVALSKYPSNFLQANLKRVYLIGGLGFRGVKVAATNSATRLYVVVKAGDPLYTDAFVENSFHHEFGHLLQRNYRRLWSMDAWTACNPPGFQYGSLDGVAAVRTGHASGRITDEWNRQGFLSEYGSEDAAEDFATVASKLFLGDPAFWGRVDRFPALAKKVGVAMAFYGKLAPRFTEAYFRSLRVATAYAERPDTPAGIPSHQ